MIIRTVPRPWISIRMSGDKEIHRQGPVISIAIIKIALGKMRKIGGRLLSRKELKKKMIQANRYYKYIFLCLM